MAGCVDININITCTRVGEGMNRAPSTMRDTNRWREENSDNTWYGFLCLIEPTGASSLKACLGLVLVKSYAVLQPGMVL